MILTLIKIDFQNMENSESNAISETDIESFSDEENITAFKKLSDYIDEQMYETKMYIGWNKEVYPQFRIKQINPR